MPSTHVSLYVHLVFSTKHRAPSIADAIRPRVHAYIGGCANGVQAVPLEIGGVDDHVHALLSLRATHRLADVVRDIKHESSRWMHDEFDRRQFAWQEGYGAFSVSESSIEGVRRYIQRQAIHHHKMSFQEEYVALLKKHGIAFDERFLW
jgi:REP element-mobilizing transposase RayT